MSHRCPTGRHVPALPLLLPLLLPFVPSPSLSPPLQLVEHIDKAAVRSLSAYYRETFQEVGDRLYGESGRLLDILDVGASW